MERQRVMVEIEVDGKLHTSLRSVAIPAVGDVISLDNKHLVDVKHRHWVIDSPPPLNWKEFRCVLECSKREI